MVTKIAGILLSTMFAQYTQICIKIASLCGITYNLYIYLYLPFLEKTDLFVFVYPRSQIMTNC